MAIYRQNKGCFTRNRIFPLLLAFFFASLCGIALRSNPAIGQISKTLRNDGILEFLTPEGSVIKRIDIEIAETPLARMRGLMGVDKMKRTEGMLFLYGSAESQVFWMRNTPLPLDIVFISDTYRIINIARDTVRMSDTQYRSEKPSKFVLEVLSGFCRQYGITAGTRIRWTRN